ncbi:MAG: hypothetical protein J7L23_01045 [Candidatus Diapherotrites archaeon]|nr:hypothetical protein [Candidatus Diapherotrites archaeon]
MIDEDTDEIEESIILATKELIEKGRYEEEIEEKLRKMRYSDDQIKAIFNEAVELIKDKQDKLKKIKFAAVLFSFMIFVFGMSLIALIQTM